MQEEIQRLLMEAQRSRYTERRTEARHPFVRPVMIYFNDAPGVQAFAKDLSNLGIGIISEAQFPDKALAVLQIHSIQGQSVFVKSEARWSDNFGKGWFLTGWKFLSIAAPPAQTVRK